MDTPFFPPVTEDAVALARAVPLQPHERDALLIDMHTRLTRIEARFDMVEDHEDRLRKVEKRQWGMPASALVALLAAIGIHIH